MSFANSSFTDIAATTIESRSGKIADNVTNNAVLLARLKKKGKIRKVSGGSQILEELSFTSNGNAGWYTGSDTLGVAAQDVISAAAYSFKQAACAVTLTGMESLQNSGEEAMIDLMAGRLEVAEASMSNLITTGLYSDGTGSGGKQLTGLGAGVVASPSTGTYGGIDRASFSFWRNQVLTTTGTQSASIIQASMNNLWAKCVRGSDKPDLIVFDANLWGFFTASLQLLQRFTSSDEAELGFPSIKFMGADVVLDGGIGGACPANTGYFLNTNYLSFRPHQDRNMVPLSPNKRVAVNQDVEVQILAWAGNLTCRGAQFQGFFQGY